MPKKNEVSAATLTKPEVISVANYSTNSDSFDIRNYVDRLEKSPKSKSKYICPVCGGSSLDIDSSSGKYHCFSSDCSSQDIREAIAPWETSPRNPKNNGRSVRSNYNGSRKPQPKSKPQPAPIPNHVELATFTPDDFPEKRGNQTIYKYSDRQWVERTDSPNGKKVLPFHSGAGKAGKGDSPWPMYREAEAREHGLDKFVLMVEGEKCVESVRSIGLAAVTFQGGSWTPTEIESAILRLKGSGIAGIACVPDNDKPGFKKADLISNACAKWEMPYVQIDPKSLGISQEKDDIADYIIRQSAQNMSSQQIRETLEQIFLESANQHRELNQEFTTVESSEEKPTKLPASSVVADALAKEWKDELIYDQGAATWREWNGIFWEKKHPGDVLAEITKYLRFNQWKFSGSYVADCKRLLEWDLRKPSWPKPPTHLINFRNGVLNLKTNQLEPHSREYGFLVFLDRDYLVLEKIEQPLDMLRQHAPIFSEWLNFTFENKPYHQLRILALIAGVIRGEFARVQRFPSIIGDPGTGKGTLARFIEKVVGTHNTESSSLRVLCGSNPDYAISKIIDKPLVILPDEDTVSKNLGVVKSLTGGDRVDYRAPYSPPASGIFTGTLLAMGNYALFAGNTTGIGRREWTIAMNRVVENRDPDFETKLESELCQVTSIALSLAVKDLRQILNDNTDARFDWEQRCQVSSLALWMEESIAFDAEAIIPLKVLTAGYNEWCDENGERAVSHKRFSPNLCHLSQEIFSKKLEIIRKRGGNYVQGIRLAYPSDPMLSDLLESKCVGSGPKCVGSPSRTYTPSNHCPETVSESGVQVVQDFGQKLFSAKTSPDCHHQSDRPQSNPTTNPAENARSINCTEKVKATPKTEPSATTRQTIQPFVGVVDHLEKVNNSSTGDGTQQQKKSLVAESTKQIKELKRSCYPSMSDNDYRDRFRNLLLTLYGVPDRSQMTLEQLRDFIHTLNFWNRQGAKFKPQGWELKMASSKFE